MNRFRREGRALNIIKESTMHSSRIAVATAVLGLLASSAQSEPACGDLRKYLDDRSDPFTTNRGELVGNLKWKPGIPLPGGNCIVSTTSALREFGMDCSFNAGAPKAVMLSSYQSLGRMVQDCLNEMESRDDWRKRDTSSTENGRVITTTTWTWTRLRYRTEQQILVSNNPEGPNKGENVLTVIWRRLPRD